MMTTASSNRRKYIYIYILSLIMGYNMYAQTQCYQSLSEIESFVKKNKHLPNLPSANDVSKNGIELGEMNAKLLQKIEELTLHLIELKKENEEIKKLIIKE